MNIPPPGPELAAYRVQMARNAMAERRAAVLANPDLVEELRRRPLEMDNPMAWNGYVPPEQWNERPNEAPQYLALVRICAEAMRRAQEGAA